MTRMKRHSLLVALLVIAALALAGLAAGCGDNQSETTSSASPTSSTDTTAGSTTSSETGQTMVQGGKSLDEYRADIPELEKAVAADPNDVSSWEGLAIAHYWLGEYDQAAEAYQKILAVVSDAPNSAFISNALGNVYREQGKYDEAIAQYEKAIALDPTLKFPYINEATVWAKFKGDMAKAQEVLNRAQAALGTEDAKVAEDYQKELTSTTTT